MLFEPLFAHAAKRPEGIAVIDDLGRHSYSQLAASAAGLGMYISFQTEKPHVGLLLPAGAGSSPVSTEHCSPARRWCRSTFF
jgi:hypothetical protein